MKAIYFKIQKVFQMSAILFILINIISMTYANSGPTVIEEYPVTEMTVDEDNEIIVNHETLIFDLSSDLGENGAKVKAIYEMKNISDEIQNVHMIFPLVSTVKSLQNNVSIQNDDDLVVPQKCYLDSLNYRGDLPRFDTLIKQCKTKPLLLTSNFTCYEFIPQSSKKVSNLEVKFNKTVIQAKILAQNANSYDYRDGNYVVTCWFNEAKNENLKLFLMDGELESLEYNKDFKVEKTTLSKEKMNELLIEMLFKDDPILYPEGEKGNMVNEALYSLYDAHKSMILMESLKDYLYQDRVILLSYDIAFEPNQTHEITVAYPMMGTWDISDSSKPTYTFEYFLKPAAYWKKFKELELVINLEAPYEYVISSSLPLTRKSNQEQAKVAYVANFDQLPKSDLTFTVYTKDKITAIDRFKGEWNRYYGYVFFLMVLPVIFAILIVVGIIWIIREVAKV